IYLDNNIHKDCECAMDCDGDGIKDGEDNCPCNPLISKTTFRVVHPVFLDVFRGNQPVANWNIEEGAIDIEQTDNAQASLIYGEHKLSSVDYEGTFFVNFTKDDDYAGFVFSYQSSSLFYVAMWKRGTTPESNDGTRPLAIGGLQIKKVQSVTGPGKELGSALWFSGDTPGQVKLLYLDPAGAPWVPQVSFRWELIHRPKIGLIRIRFLEANGQVVVDTGNIFDSDLLGGRVGLYVASQRNVGFKLLNYECNELVPKEVYNSLTSSQKSLTGVDPEPASPAWL
ncbi:unnamed protein product, partial [Meganyctiphanes norvegica]